MLQTENTWIKSAFYSTFAKQMDEKPSTIMLFFKLVRYPNLLIMAATQVFAAFCLSTEPFSPFTNAGFIFTLLATLLIAAGGYIINDIFDAAADGVNKPDKTFITPANRNFYAQVYYGLSAVGILLGLAANVFVGAICAAMAVLLYLYSYKLKKNGTAGQYCRGIYECSNPGYTYVCATQSQQVVYYTVCRLRFYHHTGARSSERY
ncbi:UbiA family prenyltransferase [Oscillatoria amoena NRMC-F 0135]|nr:UbiA family prenyltransferase [Oscillatoria amoena NRMC-F 0135]